MAKATHTKPKQYWEYCVNRFVLPKAIENVHKSVDIRCRALRLAHGKSTYGWVKDSIHVTGNTLVVVWRRLAPCSLGRSKSKAASAAE